MDSQLITSTINHHTHTPLEFVHIVPSQKSSFRIYPPNLPKYQDKQQTAAIMYSKSLALLLLPLLCQTSVASDYSPPLMANLTIWSEDGCKGEPTIVYTRDGLPTACFGAGSSFSDFNEGPAVTGNGYECEVVTYSEKGCSGSSDSTGTCTHFGPGLSNGTTAFTPDSACTNSSSVLPTEEGNCTTISFSAIRITCGTKYELNHDDGKRLIALSLFFSFFPKENLLIFFFTPVYP